MSTEDYSTSVEDKSTIICNKDKNLNTIKILTRVKIADVEIETLALVDTRYIGA